ncbi:Serine--tRNA ligase, mitochondrial [Scheffersomyces spartinae]|uniref:serine--tRNA ligase n=1 Tax=Scheffersomyces spartinae TaxID=45513 RepID=A0A9P8AGL0_9ASCO|nr:Serine--tRNA ligase, mitochondrial [Scheffersomyces spartinae]KAG7191859.1 Serine--tRNA ligase, mitochondrial [Scheffersomyces spartinae]
MSSIIKRFTRSSSTFKNTNILLKPAFDLKRVIANKDAYLDSISRRNCLPSVKEGLEYILNNRELEKNISSSLNQLRAERKKLASTIKGKQDTQTLDTLKSYKKQIQDLEVQQSVLAKTLHDAADNLPNLLDPGVPEDPEEGTVVEFINCDSELHGEQLRPKDSSIYDHKTIAEKLNIVDFSTASRVSGSSWYYLKGDGALLEQALVQYGLKKARLNGYKMLIPPSIVQSEVVNACGFKPRDQNNEQQVYSIEGSSLALTATAEIPLGGLHSSSTFPSKQDFPVKYVGVSRSYRAEAGARGKDTKGLYRVHEFTKVELFHFTTEENSQEELEQLKQFQIEIIKDLGLSAKMINMPTTDLGAPASKKYDCEAWMPGRGAWGELTSSSNCTDFQSRRLGIKHIDGESGKLKYVHTLNGTCMAVPRVIVALIEQFYDPATESILIPKVLRPYMDDKERIVKN